MIIYLIVCKLYISFSYIKLEIFKTTYYFNKAVFIIAYYEYLVRDTWIYLKLKI